MEYKALISVLAQSLSILRPLQQLWQLGDIGRYPPRLIACEQVRRRPPSGLGLEIHVSQRLTIVVADDEETAVVFLDVPRRWEAARLVLHRRESGGGGRCCKRPSYQQKDSTAGGGGSLGAPSTAAGGALTQRRRPHPLPSGINYALELPLARERVRRQERASFAAYRPRQSCADSAVGLT